jgi:F-type H+-transporting ATPase subunit epsilon
MLRLSIITPDQTVYEGAVDSVTLPTSDGEITVLPHHVPIITTVVPGAVIAREAGGEMIFAVSRGVIEVGNDEVRVLSDIADRADLLEEAAVEKARESAEKLMAEKHADAVAFADAAALLDRELGRIRAVRRHRSRRSFIVPPSNNA